MVFLSHPGDFVVVDALCILVQAVAVEMVQHPRRVDRAAVGQMAAVGQVHAQDRISRLQRGEIDRHVGLGAGMGLDIGVFRAEEFLGPLDGQGFRHIHELAAAVVTVSRISLGVFVRHDAAHGFHDGDGRVVFRRDHFQIVLLAVFLQFNGTVDFFVYGL